MTHQPVPSTRLIDTFDTDNAGTLSMGDEFEFKLTGEEGNWSAWVFHGHIVHPKGGEWINAYGGDPIRKGQEHRRQWHALPVDGVRSGAKTIRSTWRAKRAAHA